ncbi:hypothetical protein DEO72_LG9g67 [Vigna unguiculata]|uniref:Uncharacterized protein n=1 Tax=Vigna unguiculata TaxID=3917 RepID=A0A4D6MZ00_VIGUN|nr:hypothetical protein DEO72_LG9g67 [Vigna unguiculata]
MKVLGGSSYGAIRQWKCVFRQWRCTICMYGGAKVYGGPTARFTNLEIGRNSPHVIVCSPGLSMVLIAPLIAVPSAYIYLKMNDGRREKEENLRILFPSLNSNAIAVWITVPSIPPVYEHHLFSISSRINACPIVSGNK